MTDYEKMIQIHHRELWEEWNQEEEQEDGDQEAEVRGRSLPAEVRDEPPCP